MKYQKVPMSHLHVHSSYSELDAISKIPQLVQRASQYGHDALALTDHGTIAGLPKFHEECNKQGIKPILSCEFYFVPDAKKPDEDMTTDQKKEIRKKQRKRGHIVLSAMNLEGWTNLKKLVTRSNKQFYYMPIIGYNDLKEFGNGLICLSGCLKNQIKQAIIAEDYAVAVEHLLKFQKIFGDRYYLEIQDGGLDVQLHVNRVIRRLSEKFNIPLVATQDAHYIDPKDAESHEAIWGMRTRQTLDMPSEADIKTVRGRCDGKECSTGSHKHDHNMDECRVYYSTKEFWVKDGHHILNESLHTEFGEERKSTIQQKEIEESAKIADRIESYPIKDGLHLPKYEFLPDTIPSPEGPIIIREKENPQLEYLKFLVNEGYEEVYETKIEHMTQEHKDRLKKELTDIESANLADYFLIVWDIINDARKKKIRVGPGRGSAAGSMVSFCLGITKIDPIKYGLIWERFYNAGRKGSLADIDSDFSKAGRPKVIDYIAWRFGKDRVAQMVTFNAMKAKAALKDTAKILGKGGMSFEDANVMTRFVDKKPNTTIEKSLAKSEKLQEYQEKNPKLFRIAKMLEGCPKSRGTHAAGVIISDKPFEEGGVPLRWMTKDKKEVTEFDGETLESLGYLKVDILGLKTMDVLSDVEEDINGKG